MLRLSRRLARAGAAGIGMGFLIVTGFVFWVTTTASANDASFEEDVATIFEEPVRHWQGCYVGISAGYSFGDASITASPGVTITNAESDDFAYGAYVGCGIQSGAMVYGFEADVNGGDSPGVYGSVRFRAGTTIGGDMLLYLTAGIAFANQEFTATNGMVTVSHDDDVAGYAFGGGLERILSDRIALRLEAIHYDYNKRRVNLGGGQFGRTALGNTVIRAGLTFLFNGGGPLGGGTDPDVIQ